MTLALTVGAVGFHLQRNATWRRLNDNNTLAFLSEAGATVRAHTQPQDLVLVDEPVVAFVAGRRVPPRLAMITRKRIATGHLIAADLIAALKQYSPAVIVLCTGKFRPMTEFIEVLRRNYEPITTLRGETEFAHTPTACNILRRAQSRTAER
ncbi:MAG: hypothetical protein ACREIB_12580 [Pseudomonadota bacterium]